MYIQVQKWSLWHLLVLRLVLMSFFLHNFMQGCNFHKEEDQLLQMSLSDIIFNVMNRLQPKLHLMTSNRFWKKATVSKSPLRRNKFWPLSENKFFILGENIQSYIRQFSLIRILEELWSTWNTQRKKNSCCFRELV